YLVDLSESWIKRPDEFAILPVGRLSLEHEAEKVFSKFAVPNRVEQNRTVTETRDHCVRCGLRNIFGVFGRGDLYRQGVVFGRAIKITDFDNPKLGGTRGMRNRGAFNHAHLSQDPCFGSEPPAGSNVFRQNLVLDLIALAVCEQ